MVHQSGLRRQGGGLPAGPLVCLWRLGALSVRRLQAVLVLVVAGAALAPIVATLAAQLLPVALGLLAATFVWEWIRRRSS